MLPHFANFIVGVIFFLNSFWLVIPSVRYKYSAKKTAAVYLAAIIVVVLMLFVPLPDNMLLSFAYSMLLTVPLTAAMCFLAADNFFVPLYVFWDMHNVAFAVSTVRVMLFYSLPQAQGIAAVVLIELCMIIVFVLRWKNRAKHHVFLTGLNTLKRPFFIFPFTVGILCRFFISFMYDNIIPGIEYVVVVVLLLGFMASYLVRYSVNQFQKAAEAEKLMNENRLITGLMAKQKEQIAQYEDAQQQLAIQRHDTRHHYLMLAQLQQQGLYEQADSYLQKVLGVLSENEVKIYCLHHTVNAAISIYAQQIEKANIDFSIRVNVPRKIGINEVELASVFANTLENALQSCKNASAEKPFIRLIADYSGNCLHFLLENTIESKVSFNSEGLPISQSVNGGTGSKSISYVVEKYNGVLDFAQEGNVFSTMFTLCSIS